MTIKKKKEIVKPEINEFCEFCPAEKGKCKCGSKTSKPNENLNSTAEYWKNFSSKK
jgi:hypothetical protein